MIGRAGKPEKEERGLQKRRRISISDPMDMLILLGIVHANFI